MLMLAGQAGVPVTEVVAAGTASTGDAVLVTVEPPAQRLADLPRRVSDELLARVWDVALRLRDASLAHGSLNAGSILVADGEVVVTGMAGARRSRGSDVLAIDLAELLVSCALLVGDAAIRSALAAVGDEAVRSALPFVQHAALSPWLRDAVHRAGADVDQLRRRAAGATGGEVPEVAQLRRIQARDVLLMLLTVVAAVTLLISSPTSASTRSSRSSPAPASDGCSSGWCWHSWPCCATHWPRSPPWARRFRSGPRRCCSPRSSSSTCRSRAWRESSP